MQRALVMFLSLLALSACSMQEARDWCATALICTCLYNNCEDMEHY